MSRLVLDPQLLHVDCVHVDRLSWSETRLQVHLFCLFPLVSRPSSSRMHTTDEMCAAAIWISCERWRCSGQRPETTTSRRTSNLKPFPSSPRTSWTHLDPPAIASPRTSRTRRTTIDRRACRPSRISVNTTSTPSSQQLSSRARPHDRR